MRVFHPSPWPARSLRKSRRTTLTYQVIAKRLSGWFPIS
jgi:hypothetical protein